MQIMKNMTHIKRVNEMPSEQKKADKLFDKYLDNFDINSIPISVLDSAYRDIEDEFEFTNRNCREWVLEEGYGVNESIQDENIESTKEIINRLITIYKFDEKLFKAFSPHKVQIVEVKDLPVFMETVASVVVANICNNIDIIDKEMKLGGYYRSRCAIFEDDKGRSWANLVYDPIRQDTISEQIRNHCMTLFHYSEKNNYDSIRENGLLPKNEKRRYDYYQKRVYLFPERLDGVMVSHNNMMNGITQNRKRKNPKFNGEYYRYMISMDKVPKNIEFFYDPHGNGCIYTTEKIPYSSIVDETLVKF